MSQKFSLKDYKKEETNTKVKVFIEFLYKNFGGLSTDSEEFDNDYFTWLTERELLESLEYYIARNQITSQVAADNYITYLKDFFDMLSSKYNIKNDVFVNREQNKQFISKSKNISTKLKKSESKYIASDEQYEELNTGIDDYLKTLDENDIYEEVRNCKNGKYVKIYHRFVSIIAIKLIMRFALSNLTVISLDIKSIDMEQKVLVLDGIDLLLPLDEELIKLLKAYLRIREYVLQLYDKTENKLFIKPDGNPYKTDSANSRDKTQYVSFFMIMDDYIHTRSADLFASRRIVEMLEKGLDISTISKLSGRAADKCIKLQKNYLNNDASDRLLKLLTGDDIHTKKKPILICPFCDKEVNVTSEDWILVQYESDGAKYLACKGCKGKNGKLRLQNI